MTRNPVAVVTATIPLTLDLFHRELMRQLVADGFVVHVVSSPGPSLDRLAAELPIITHAIPMMREVSLWADAVALLRWARLMRHLRPSLLVTATPKASLLGQLAARLARVPNRLYYVGGLRMEGETGRRRALLTTMERLTAANASVLVANSPSLARRIVELRIAPAGKVNRTVPASSHGVDTSYFSPRPPDRDLAERIGLHLEQPVVGFVGRLTHDKGIDTLIGAARVLAVRRPTIQLLLVGPQDEADSRRYLTELEGSGLRTILVGAVADVRPFMALATVNVLPTLREGFPNVVLEAAAMGIPTVTTDATGAVDSVVPEKTGLMVPVGDPVKLAQAIERLLADPALAQRLGSAARATAVADFVPSAVVASLLQAILRPRRPRVLHVINSLSTGGAERLVTDLAEGMEDRGAASRIAVLHGPLPTNLPVSATVLGQHRFDPRAVIRLWREMRQSDIVHAHLFPAFWAVALLPSRLSIVTEHSPDNGRRHAPLLGPLERWIYSRFTGVAAISEGVAESLRNYLGRDAPPIHVVPNGVRLERFSVRREPKSGRDGLEVVVVGSLDSRKDVATAIRAVAGLSGVRLRVVGDGPQRESLAHLANQVEGTKVLFLGRRHDIPEILATADVFLSTSRYEGFGIAAVEAMAAGVPVVAPCVPGLSEVVGDAGLLYPPGDIPRIREILLELAHDPELLSRLSKRAHTRSREFAIERTTNRYLALYDSLSGESGRRQKDNP